MKKFWQQLWEIITTPPTPRKCNCHVRDTCDCGEPDVWWKHIPSDKTTQEAWDKLRELINNPTSVSKEETLELLENVKIILNKRGIPLV